MVAKNNHSLEEILATYQGKKGALLEIFHRIQEELGWVSPEACQAIGRTLGMSPSLIYGTLTFYADFRTKPPPQHEVSVCEGPACVLRGAKRLERAAQVYLGLKINSQAEDNSVSLKAEQCSGLCTLAPYLRINGELKPNLRAMDLPEVLAEIRKTT